MQSSGGDLKMLQRFESWVTENEVNAGEVRASRIRVGSVVHSHTGEGNQASGGSTSPVPVSRKSI